MARLPTPGGDDGTWGTILNDYLGVQHNADGTHNLSLDGLSDVSTVGATSGQVLKFNGTTWVADTDNAGSSDPAVGGDLSGTASNAQIVAGAVGAAELADSSVTEPKLDASNLPSSGQVLSWNGTNFTWVNQTSNTGYVQGDGIAKITVGVTAPTAPAVGDLWVNT